MERMERPIIAVTLGDPAGIGPEIVVKANLDEHVRSCARVVAVGPVDALHGPALDAGVPIEPVQWDREATDGTLEVIEVPGDLAAVRPGEVSAEAGRLAVCAVDAAVELALAG